MCMSVLLTFYTIYFFHNLSTTFFVVTCTFSKVNAKRGLLKQKQPTKSSTCVRFLCLNICIFLFLYLSHSKENHIRLKEQKKVKMYKLFNIFHVHLRTNTFLSIFFDSLKNYGKNLSCYSSIKKKKLNL